LPHARGLEFKPRRGGFPSGAKKEWGLSPKAKQDITRKFWWKILALSVPLHQIESDTVPEGKHAVIIFGLFLADHGHREVTGTISEETVNGFAVGIGTEYDGRFRDINWDD
ncbi:hypothetical protein Tco_1389199, partial [Tanacetum coccineum]